MFLPPKEHGLLGRRQLASAAVLTKQCKWQRMGYISPKVSPSGGCSTIKRALKINIGATVVAKLEDDLPLQWVPTV